MQYKGELSEAIENGDLNAVREHFEPSDLASNEYDGGESSLLHFAVEYGTLEIVRFLIEQGADVNRLGGSWEAPPITYAAYDGKLEMVRCLTDAGSVLDIHHPLQSPFLWAAGEGHLEVVKYFLTKSIDRHATYRLPTGALINALLEAEKKDHKEIAALLIAHGCRRPVEGVDTPLWEPDREDRLDLRPENKRYQETIRYMEQRFGPVDTDGMQELLPMVQGMSVAINVIRPNEGHPFLVLFTNGMSDLPMSVPTGQEAWRYAELVMHLPADWEHPREASGDIDSLWPVRWLRKLAYYPHLNNTWLGRPATIVSSDDPPVPLGENTKQSCLFLVPDHSLLNPPLQREDGNVVHFFTAVPLYTEERDYENKHGMKEFLTRFSKARVPMTVSIDRPNFGIG